MGGEGIGGAGGCLGLAAPMFLLCEKSPCPLVTQTCAQLSICPCSAAHKPSAAPGHAAGCPATGGGKADATGATPSMHCIAGCLPPAHATACPPLLLPCV